LQGYFHSLRSAEKKSAITKEEFLKSFQAVIDYVKKAETNLTSKIESKTQSANNELQSYTESLKELKGVYGETIKRIEEDNQSTLSNLKRWALERVGELFIKSKVNEELTQALIEVNSKLSEAERRLQEIQPLDDAKIILKASNDAFDTLKPLIPVIIPLKEELPKMGEPIRDALEALEGDERLDWTAIKGLEDLIRRLKSNTVMGGGISMGGLNLHFIDDEEPTNSGDDLNFTINHPPSPVSSLKVFRNGQRLKLTEDFTFTGQTITLLTALGATEQILCDYRI